MPTGWRVGFGPAAGPARMHEPGTADRGRRPLIGPFCDLNQHRQTNRGHKSTTQTHYELIHIRVGFMIKTVRILHQLWGVFDPTQWPGFGQADSLACLVQANSLALHAIENRGKHEETTIRWRPCGHRRAGGMRKK